MKTLNISLEELSDTQLMNLIGVSDKNLLTLASLFKIDLYINDMHICSSCDNASIIKHFNRVINELINEIKKGNEITEQLVRYVFSELDSETYKTWNNDMIARRYNGQPLYAKTAGQRNFIDTIYQNDITFAMGPAGTGKTYLAVVLAVTLLKNGDFKKIVLTRPAVEAGENLGFLPGDLKEKVDPYLTPLYDALNDMLGIENTKKLIEKGVIEIAPLAYMRGRTLNEAFVILDEAQNTTNSQMKMFLTRLGFQSKMVITGDQTQIDIKHNEKNGLIHASHILKDVENIKIMKLSVSDVVRNPLVQKIIESYENNK